MTDSQFDLSLVALCAWREARGEGPDGMRAVVHVIFNRAKAWGKSLRAVVTGKNQFSSMFIRGDPNTVLWPGDNDSLFAALLAQVDEIAAGSDEDLTNGALYYANEAMVTSGWYMTQIVQQPNWHPVVATIGRHTFRT